MKIREEIIEMLRLNADIRREIIYRMKWSEPTYYRILRENEINGDLTKIVPLRLIASGLGVAENEILTKE
jgi:DNA invertase Pin-like site-specific DNA recombinase